MRASVTMMAVMWLISASILAQAAPHDERYEFDNLESVERFRNWQISGWNVVDQRSLIVHTSPSRAYLLILDRDVHELPWVESIALSSTVSTVNARFDTVRALSRTGITIPARIVRIYKLESREQRRMVTEQIRGREPTHDPSPGSA